MKLPPKTVGKKFPITYRRGSLRPPAPKILCTLHNFNVPKPLDFKYPSRLAYGRKPPPFVTRGGVPLVFNQSKKLVQFCSSKCISAIILIVKGSPNKN